MWKKNIPLNLESVQNDKKLYYLLCYLNQHVHLAIFTTFEPLILFQVSVVMLGKL